MRNLIRTGLLAGMTATCLLADASYDQTVKYTGGTLLDMMRGMASNPILGRLGGGSLKTAFEDQNFKVYVKGSKMARIGDLTSTIYDLDAGTVTTINHQKRSYVVQTFEEMRQEMERMQQRGHRGQSSDIDFDVKIDKTGQTRTIDGQSASETLMTMTAKSASANGQMVVKADFWLLPSDPSKREVMDYSKRLAEKYAYAFSGGPGLGAAGAGIAAAMREGNKFDGYPVLYDVDVSGVASPMPAMGQRNSDPNAPLLKMETQSSHFASESVDDSKFSVPAGYSQGGGRR